MIEVVIADDHPVVREGLRRILSESDDIRVVGEAESGEEVVERARELAPDLVLLDVAMPGPGFLETVQSLQTIGTRILVLSIYPEEQFGARAIRAGVSGYLTKERSPTELLGAIRQVQRGERYVSPSLAEKLDAPVDEGQEEYERLSEREFQVVQMLGSGRTVKQISEALKLSPKTISTYRARAIRKLGLETTPDLVRYAVQNDLVDPTRAAPDAGA